MKKINKEQRIKTAIFKILNEGECEIRLIFLKNYKLGECENDLIKISPLPNGKPYDGLPKTPAATLVHELLHFLFPEDSETEIKKISKNVWREIKPLEKLALYEHLFENF